MGNRAAGQRDVVGQLTQQRKAVPTWDAGQYRLKQLAADRSWQHPVVIEDPVFQVAHVAAEQLVASVAGQDHVVADLPAHPCTVEAGPHGRIDRNSVSWGTSVSVRLALVGARLRKTKNRQNINAT